MSELMLPGLTGTKPVMRAVLGNQDDMYVLQSKSMSDLMSSSLTGIKTAESSSGEQSKFFCVFSSKSDVAHQPYWH